VTAINQIVDTRERLQHLQAIASSLCVARVWRAAGHVSTVGDVAILQQQVETELVALAERLDLSIFRTPTTRQPGASQ
jgi:hypothetical protein